MLYILLSVCCSISVAILLKTARRFEINIQQSINWNYLAALVLCYLTFSPDVKILKNSVPWKFYFPLSILLPVIFLFLAASVKNIGIVKTEIAQRLSLFIPILASFFIFNENISVFKFIGLAIGFMAIFLTLNRKSESANENNSWIYPLFVLFGFGIIDVLFKQIALYNEIPFTTSLFFIFCGAFCIASLITLYYLIFCKRNLTLQSFLFGIILGIFNFGNILFYLRAHKVLSDNPSTVFAAMNFGVIIIGTLIGVTVFNEKITRINYLGIACAVMAVIIITISQLYAY
ncbi:MULTISPECIES: DMT family transporter [Flavobacterium]|uniref:DMT family transporter n=1 Tax=Flavobacterium TaxID=237 RepID=UPI001FCC03BD|nr:MULTISPECIES: DMT family transporter [Flavobacterium]UOK41734.1 DMT family transporter [Flavobacterium enshiense]